MTRALRPDAQKFDEVRITTVPRYKTSGLSGDEWRISAHVQFFRKGVLKHETSFRDVETACGFLYAEFHQAEGGYFAGEGLTCDQEGCARTDTLEFQVLYEYSRDNPHEWKRPVDNKYRRFCPAHETRGDAGFDDADDNYE